MALIPSGLMYPALKNSDVYAPGRSVELMMAWMSNGDKTERPFETRRAAQHSARLLRWSPIASA